jgi:hypothetical protein
MADPLNFLKTDWVKKLLCGLSSELGSRGILLRTVSALQPARHVLASHPEVTGLFVDSLHTAALAPGPNFQITRLEVPENLRVCSRISMLTLDLLDSLHQGG